MPSSFNFCPACGHDLKSVNAMPKEPWTEVKSSEPSKTFIPNGWTVVEHKNDLSTDLTKVRVSLYLSESQKNGVITGYELRKELADKPVLNANALEFLLANPHLIPEDWKSKYVFFWGTIYRDGDGSLCVRCLSWVGGRWVWGCRWLDNQWYSDYPAAVLADLQPNKE